MLHLPHKQPTTTNLGRVADFCPICRRPTAQVLKMHGQAWHWMGLRFGAIALENYTRTCDDCGTVQPAEEGHYRAKAGWRRLPIDQLIARTQPNLAHKYAQRLELEARLLVAPELLTPGERAALIREPFDVLAPRIEQVFRDKVWDAPVVAALGFAVLAPFAAAPLAMAVTPTEPTHALWAGGATCAAGLLAALAFNLRSPGRYLRRRAFPRIAATLRPLAPTAAEVTAALEQQRARGRRFGTPRHVAWMVAALG